MRDHLTTAQRSRAMRRVKLKDGSLEKLVQGELRARGLSFRRHVRTLPGRPDIVFNVEKVAVFVDGDFWHGWRLPAWEHKLSPFWRDKLRANRARDSRNFRKLRSRGWKVIRLWQHQITTNLEDSIARITGTVVSTQANKRIPEKNAVRSCNPTSRIFLAQSGTESGRRPRCRDQSRVR